MQDPYKDFKVIKLPRNGPKSGQSADHWQAGKDKGEDAWAKKSPKAALTARDRGRSKTMYGSPTRSWRHKW